MKKLFLCIAVCAGIFTTAIAGNDDLKSIISMDASKGDVIKLLGEPDEILAVKSQTHWSYQKEDVSIKISWEEASSSIKYLSYESEANRNEDWSVKNHPEFKIEETAFDDVLKELGMPDNMFIKEGTVQSARYRYNNYTLNMHFTEGTLKTFSLHKV